MLRPFVKIKIQQVPTAKWKDRRRFLELDFCTYYEVCQGWEDHTDTAKIMLPKNIYVQRDKEEALFAQRGTFNAVIGGSGYAGQGFNIDPADGSENTNAPLIMKGDIVTIFDGYLFRNEQNVNQVVKKQIFQGFVSRVKSKIPLEIELEDAFYLLKRTPVNKSVWTGDMVSLCKHMIDECNKNFAKKDFGGTYVSAFEMSDYKEEPIYDNNPYPLLTFNDKVNSITADFSLGHLDIGDVTCGELLARLRNQYHMESFFVGNKLHFGFPIYDESRANSDNYFIFEETIEKENNLEYKNKDDVVLSAIVRCQVVTKSGRKTKDDKDGTKKERKSILVYWDIVTESFKFYSKKKGEQFPENTGGERHEFPYCVSPGIEPSDETLFNYGVSQLEKYMYTGFKGDFNTIGFPYVQWNDNVNLWSDVISDRCGQYKVKKVVRKGGSSVRGIKQNVSLDYKQKVTVEDPSRVGKIFML